MGGPGRFTEGGIVGGTMRGEPLMLCPQHEGEEGVWFRQPRGCPLCRALEELRTLRERLLETGQRPVDRKEQ